MHVHIMRALRILIALISCLVFGSCKSKSNSFDYKIALDPAWYSLELPGRETALTTFTLELIEAIGKIEGITVGIYQQSWNDLIYGLQQDSYDAVCSTLQPYLFYDKLYEFSDLYLLTGPVLVVSSQIPSPSLAQMGGKIIGIQRSSNAALILEKYPEIIQRTYDSIQQALQDITKDTIDAAIIDVLTAEAFTQNLFQHQLKVASAPLTQEGIRLVSLKGQASDLILRFNRGLKKLKANGTYSALVRKWNLADPASK